MVGPEAEPVEEQLGLALEPRSLVGDQRNPVQALTIGRDHCGRGVGIDRVGQNAFLIGEPEFDALLGRIHGRGLEHWADPFRRRPGEINHNDGGRGVYFPDPDGHHLEVITRPYGSGTG